MHFITFNMYFTNVHFIVILGELESAGFDVDTDKIARKDHCELVIGKDVVWSCSQNLFQAGT